ncbi:MAG: transglutaminase domain-containing protein [Acidobacteriota bacterium]
MRNTNLCHSLHPLRRIASQLMFVLLLTACAIAQTGDREARAAQWDSYQLPGGEFTRFVDRQKGFSFWHPLGWKDRVMANGAHLFQPETQSVNLVAITDDIPEGYGVANYASGYLQSLRSQSVVEDSVMVRRVMMSGLEWRELSYDLEARGSQFHQTMWLTAVGARVYGLAFTTKPGELEKEEPLFKRIVMTVRVMTAGHEIAGEWNEEFENLRAKFASTAKPAAGREVAAILIADELRAARISFDATVSRLTELFNSSGNASPDAVFDLTTDADPQVRAAAITALGKARQDELGNDALVWALSDTDVFASTAAARSLAARGKIGLDAIKSKIPVPRALRPEAMVRAGLAFDPQSSNELMAELLRTESANDHLGALQLALAMPQFDGAFPYSKLLGSHNLGVRHATTAILQRHYRGAAATEATKELLKMLRGDNEDWVARALGEVAPVSAIPELNKRIAEIDARFTVLGKAKPAAAGKTPSRKGSPANKNAPPAEQFDPIASQLPVDLKTKPEDVRLALIRGELDVAVRKIGFRDRWNQAKDDAARRAIGLEIVKSHSDLIQWSQSALVFINPALQALPAFDASRLTGGPTTGETFFPKGVISYVMSPNLDATIDKLDAALSGVQMATVRDQMTFALMLKMFKTTLADKTGASQTNDTSKAIGIDLKSPVSLATWTANAFRDGSAGNNANGAETTKQATTMRSGAVVRVTDRARFERLLVNYQEQFGHLNSFATATAGLSRFAGLLPAALPVVFSALASGETRNALADRVPGAPSRAAILSLKPFAVVRQEKFGGLTVTVFDRSTILSTGQIATVTIYLTYLNETALIASSKGALIDMVTTALAPQSSIAQNSAFNDARRESGEIVFFSDLPALLKIAWDSGDFGQDNPLQSLTKAFGAESGALRISPTSWETNFKLALADNQLTGSFKPFKADSMTAPRDLLPKSTLLYAAVMIDPPKLLDSIKKWLADSPSPGSTATESSAQSKEIERSIESGLEPAMQGEIAAAILSFKPLFDGGNLPDMVFAAKLKNNTPADALRAGTLFAKLKRVENTSVLGSAIVALGEDGEAPFAIVTGEYFVLANSVETLKLLESKERFAASRDYARSLQNTPDNLALFTTYNLEAAFDETVKVMSKSESQQMLPFISALVHAFHSQRAFVAFGKEGGKEGGKDNSLRGYLAVSFDREGRYAVGDLAMKSGDFDLANAIIPTKGLSVAGSERVEAMTLRITAKRPGVAPRVRDDLSKFAWQKIEAGRSEGNDSTIVVTTTARRVPEKLTVPLPVAGADFEQYLRPTARVNSTAPEIVALAKKIAGDDKDAHSVAGKIGDWTYKNLKWKKVQSDTVETLASREADCLEHSELYVALARSLGLPARVVTGAALGGGSFGAHAWVEVYLGKWVELDPTWGLMEHVDATHLRFDGDAFTSYAMLNQLELEIIAARRTVADFQRDPVRLVKEFSLNKETRDLALDLTLAVEHTIGTDRWNKLEDKQRAAVIKAFERTVRGLWETWSEQQAEPVRVIRNEPLGRNQANGSRRVLTVLRGDSLLRLTLSLRDGAWFLVEHEIVDDGMAEFTDAMNGALNPEARRGRIYEVSFDTALAHLDRLIAAEGEKPDLLLFKARVFSQQQNDEKLTKLLGEVEDKKDKSTEQTPPQQPERAEPAVDRAVELLKQITTRWPDFAPAQLMLGRELSSAATDGALAPLSKDTEQAIAALRRYIKLVPEDPRPWRDLATAYEQTEQFEEAEKAYRAAIERDGAYLEHHAMLVNFLLDQQALEKAKAAFAQMLKTAPKSDDVFEYLSDDEEELDADSAKIREELLLAFPSAVSMSKTALSLLSSLQEAQDKYAEAIKSIQRAIAIEAEADDYETLSRLYRKQRRFAEALNAANQALKLDDSATYVHFERACSLAQLGRKREAITALKQMSEDGKPLFFNADEPDLQPLAAMPEFKAIKEKIKETLAPQSEKDEKQGEPKKPEQTNKTNLQ